MTDPATYIEGRTVQEQMNSLIGYVEQRSAEVALDAIAADVAQVHQDMLDADADATAAAASAAAAAGTLVSAVKITGDQSIAGVKTFTGQVIVPTPTANTDAATKKYVDDADASILTAINSLDAAVVKLTGNQTVGGTKTFSTSPVGPTEATGTFSTKLATSDKVKNELDAYAPMVRTTGNQTYGGIKTMTEFARKQFSIDITEAHGDVSDNIIQIYDTATHILGYLYMNIAADNHTSIRIGVRNSDGTIKESTLLSGDHP